MPVLCSVKRSMAVDAFMQQVLLILSAVLRSSYLSCTLSRNIPDYPHSTCSWKSTPVLIWADMEPFRATLLAYPFERSFILHVLHLHALPTHMRISFIVLLKIEMLFRSHVTKLFSVEYKTRCFQKKNLIYSNRRKVILNCYSRGCSSSKYFNFWAHFYPWSSSILQKCIIEYHSKQAYW